MGRLGVILVGILLVAPIAQSSAVGQDDAASGRDAPDEPVPAVRIESAEVYQGRLQDDDRHDWYAFDAEAGQTVQVRVSGGYGCWEVARDVDEEAGHDCAAAPYAEVGVLNVTLPETGTWYLHYENVPLDAYRFSVGVDEPAASPTGGPAADRPRPFSGPQDDAGSGQDAPDTAQAEVFVESGEAYTGYLEGLLGGDWDDWYAFDGAAGDTVTARLGAVVACVEITHPNGSRIDFACSDASNEVAFERNVTVELSQTGTHFVHAYYFVPQDYGFSIGVNEPAPEPPGPVDQALPSPTAAPSEGRAPGPGPGAPGGPSVSAWLEAARTDEPLSVTVDGQPWEVHVRPNDDLLAHPAAVRDAAGEPVDLSSVHLLTGTVDEYPGSQVRLTVAPGFASGHLFVPDRPPVRVTGTGDGGTRLGSPAPTEATDATGGSGVSFEVGSEQPANHAATGCTQLTPHRVAHPLGVALGWPTRTLDTSFAVDSDFVERHGTDWPARALAWVNDLDGFYQASERLGIQAADLHAHTADEIEGNTTGKLMGDLKDHYAASHAALDRELAHLFSGQALGLAVGQANCIGGAGDPEVAYTVGQALGEEAQEFQGFRFLSDQTLKISAHEIGHILSAHHHYANCASERLSGYDPFQPFDVCTLMINDVGLASLQFSTANTLVTRGWADAEDI